MYASVYTGPGGAATGTLHVSRDGGSTWEGLSSGAYTDYVNLIVDPFTPTTLLVVTKLSSFGNYAYGLWRSVDGGSTWSDATQGLPLSGRWLTALTADPRTAGTFYVATSSGLNGPVDPNLYETTDGGVHWSLVSAGAVPGPMTALAVDPVTPTTLYAGIAGSATGTFRSDDGGRSFRALNIFPTAQVIPDPTHPGRLYVATLGQGVQTSSDGGATWKPINVGLTDLTVYQLVQDSSRGYLHAGTNGSVFDILHADQGGLVLDAAHPFAVTLTATDQRTGRTGAGVATQVNDLWGYFSIPAITGNPNNPEVFVKMLDGTAINGRFWFFYGGLTDLEYTLTVTEVSTGRQKTYTKSAGSECGGSDTGAFAR